MYNEPLRINTRTKQRLNIRDVSNSHIIFGCPYGTKMYMDVTRYDGDLISFEVTNGSEYILSSEQWQYINDWKNITQ